MVMLILTAVLSMSHVISERTAMHKGFDVDELVSLWPKVSRPQDSLDYVSVEVWKAAIENLNIQSVVDWIEEAMPKNKEAAESVRLRCSSNLNKVKSSLVNSSNQLEFVQVAVGSLDMLTYFFGAPPGLDNMNIRSWLERIDWEILTAAIVKNACADHVRCGHVNDAEAIARDVESRLGKAIARCVKEVSIVRDLDESSPAHSLFQIFKDIRELVSILRGEVVTLNHHFTDAKRRVLEDLTDNEAPKIRRQIQKDVNAGTKIHAAFCALPADRVTHLLKTAKDTVLPVIQEVEKFSTGLKTFFKHVSILQEARQRARQLPRLEKADFQDLCGGLLLRQERGVGEDDEKVVTLSSQATHMSAYGILNSIHENGLLSAAGLQKLTDGKTKALGSADTTTNNHVFFYVIPKGMQDARVERFAEMAVLTACERYQDHAILPDSNELQDRAANTVLFVLPEASVPDAVGRTGEVAINIGVYGVKIPSTAAVLCGSEQVYKAARTSGFRENAILVTGEMAMLTPMQSKQDHWNTFGPTPFSAPDYASALKSQMQLLNQSTGGGAVLHIVRLPPPE